MATPGVITTWDCKLQRRTAYIKQKGRYIWGSQNPQEVMGIRSRSTSNCRLGWGSQLSSLLAPQQPSGSHCGRQVPSLPSPWRRCSLRTLPEGNRNYQARRVDSGKLSLTPPPQTSSLLLGMRPQAINLTSLYLFSQLWNKARNHIHWRFHSIMSEKIKSGLGTVLALSYKILLLLLHGAAPSILTTSVCYWPDSLGGETERHAVVWPRMQVDF